MVPSDQTARFSSRITTVLDVDSDDVPVWLFLISGPLISLSQFIWLLMDRQLQHAFFAINLPFHLLNITLGFCVLAIVLIKPLRVQWRIAGCAIEAILMASIAFIATHGGQAGEMISSIAFLVVGNALLTPWSRKWQVIVEACGFAAIAGFAIYRSLAPYDWFASIAIIIGSHLVYELVDHSRRMIAAGKASLEAKIGELQETQRQLIDAREEALAASRAKSEFLSSMSHEIRTPMNAILGMADVLTETPLNAEQRKYLDTMVSNGNSLIELINGILDLAKIDSGRLVLEEAKFDLPATCREAMRDARGASPSEASQAALSIADGVPTNLIGDPLRLRQILLNPSATPSSSQSAARSCCELRRTALRKDFCVSWFPTQGSGLARNRRRKSLRASRKQTYQPAGSTAELGLGSRLRSGWSKRWEVESR